MLESKTKMGVQVVLRMRRILLYAAHLGEPRTGVRRVGVRCGASVVAEVFWCGAPGYGAAHQAQFLLFCLFCVLVSGS